MAGHEKEILQDNLMRGDQDSILLMPPRETAGKAPETLSDQELIRQLAAAIGAEVGAELALHRKQLDHIDEMLHRLVAFVDEHRPLLERFAKWTGAGTARGWRAWQNGGGSKKPGT